MKKFIAIFLINLLVSTAFGQEAELVHEESHKQDFATLKQLMNLDPISNTIELDVLDLNLPISGGASDFVDLYYNVYVKLDYTPNINKPALLEKVLIQNLSLNVTGSKTSSTSPFNTTTGELENFVAPIEVNPSKNNSTLIYNFGKEDIGPYDLHSLTEVSLAFSKNDIIHVDPEVLDGIMLTLYVEFGRYERSGQPALDVTIIDNDPFLKENEGLIVWNKQLHPSFYEVEWINIESATPIEDYNFENNAVRVQTNNNFYPISFLYESGSIVARVRTVRPILNEAETAILDKYEYSPWSLFKTNPSPSTNTTGNYAVVLDNTNRVLPNLNWQYNSTYASEGKKKEIINFFDGSNLKRQSVTLLTDNSSSKNVSGNTVNHNTTVIAQESYYDFNGQPLIDVLPAPIVNSNTLGYQLGLNFSGAAKLNKSNYDGISGSPVTLDINANGASQYYSPSSPLRNDVHHPENQFIPDAEQYPYTRKQYLNDGSGRVKTTYSPGAEFATDATGVKNNRFFYSKPTRSELEVLFGSNVGEMEYYKKNVTIDPNGVVSFAYIDQQDRTIATSIAGSANGISNMDPVLNTTPNTPHLFIEDLMDLGLEKFNATSNEFELQFPVFVPVDEDYTFNYGLDVNAYQPSCVATGNNICYDCRYSYVFQIMDDKGEMIVEIKDNEIEFSNTGSCIQEQFELDDMDVFYSTPNTAYNGNINLTGTELVVKLLSGQKYSVIKKLKLITDELEIDASYYVETSNCLENDEEFFIDQEIEAIDFTTCRTEFEDPCIDIVNAMRDDFKYPAGAFVKDAPKDAEIVDFILKRTRREVSCSGSAYATIDAAEIAYRDKVKAEFEFLFNTAYDANGSFQALTFENYQEKHIDFLLEYHPSYCKLKTCRMLKSEESIAYNTMLDNSATLQEFESNLQNSTEYANIDLEVNHSGSDPQLKVNATGNNASGFLGLEWNGFMSFVTGSPDRYSHNWDLVTKTINSSNYDRVLLKEDLFLIQFDKAIIDYTHNPDALEIGYFEPQNIRSDYQCIVENGAFPDNYHGNGTYGPQSDYVYLLFGFFADYYGCNSYTRKGIMELANLMAESINNADPTTNYDEELWKAYKKFYIQSKDKFIENAINASSCVPRKRWKVYPSDPNPMYAAVDFVYKDLTSGVLAPNSTWKWGRIFDHGEWWSGGSDCDIYLGEDNPVSIDELPFVNLQDPTGVHAISYSAAAMKDKLAQDLYDVFTAIIPLSCHSQDLLGTNAHTLIKAAIDQTSFFDNPYSELAFLIDATTVCGVYDVNLSPIIMPYLMLMKDNTGNPIFGVSRDENPKANCEDFHQLIINDFPGYSVGSIYNNPSDILTYGLHLPSISSPVTDETQIRRRFKNWMNYKLGIDVAFQDYNNLANSCTSDGNTSIFGKSIVWDLNLSSKVFNIKEALIQYNGTANQYLSDLDLVSIESSLNTQILNSNPGTTNVINLNNDFLGFGEIDYANSHQDLFYLENKKADFQILLAEFNEVFIAIKSDLDALGKIEDSYYAYAKEINAVQDLSVNSGGVNLIINRAVRFSNGTVWVRLLDANEDYYNDFYYHYQPFNYQSNEYGYALSDLTSFASIEPIFNEEIKYVLLTDNNTANKEFKLIASTRNPIATAERIGKTDLDKVYGESTLALSGTCEDLKIESAILFGKVLYEEYQQEKKEEFKFDYTQFCLNKTASQGFNQDFTMKYVNNEHHFTLYYYDQAGNLVMTVPPDGVKPLSYITTVGNVNIEKSAIKAYRLNNNLIPTFPPHEKTTTYQYNAANQIIKQITPNGGTTLFWYDRAGRLILSQNANQIVDHKYSYTFYDEQSRIKETGVVELPSSISSQSTNSTIDDIWNDVHHTIFTDKIGQNLLNGDYVLLDEIAALDRKDVIKTYYDDDSELGASSPTGFSQDNLRSRVATQAYFAEVLAGIENSNWNYATHYSYDVVGNVKTVLNDYLQKDYLTDPEYRFKRIDYAFDPVSGNVQRVYYQLGKDDAFYHKYNYDAENRITEVYTSNDGVIWDKDANYKYYLHGPLARTEIGNSDVQGIDYAYTLQGWLKLVNSGKHTGDIGYDNLSTSGFGKDAFGFALHYFDGDFTSITGSITANNTGLMNHTSSKLANLYNGNIAAKSMHNLEASIGKVYQYDQLNRLKNMNEHLLNGSDWGDGDINGYGSFYEYDGNGNITDLQRYNGQEGETVDDMDYTYIAGTDQLDHVADDYIDDGTVPGEFIGQSSGNYEYDDIGNLTKDEKAKISNILWYPNGKIKEVVRINPIPTEPNLYFEYDALGNRVKKQVSFVQDGKYFVKSTYYVRDAQGNVMATYDEKDCRFEEDSESDGEFYYQYSENYSAYINEMLTTLTNGETDLLAYLNGAVLANGKSFSKASELLDNAYNNLSNIDDLRNLIWANFNAVDYLTLYPDASQRVLAENPHYYADYLFQNNFTAFLEIVNYKNEAYIEALKEDNLIQSFYDDFNTQYANLYNSTAQVDNIIHMLNLNRNVIYGLLGNSSDLKSFLRLSTSQYNEAIKSHNDPELASANLIAYFNQLNTELESGELNNEAKDLIKQINALLLFMELSESNFEGLFDEFNFSILIASLDWMDTDYAKLLRGNLFNLHAILIDLELSSPIDPNELGSFLPMDAIDWSEDNNGEYLSHFLKVGVAHEAIKNVSINYFDEFNMNDADYYFDNGLAKTYVVQALLAHSNQAEIVASIIDIANISTTKATLYLTEDLAHIKNYLKTYHSIEVLRLNLYHDNLEMAFRSVVNYSPIDFAEELKDDFESYALQFETLSNCSTDNSYLALESFEIYGSSRLGVVNAEVARKDDNNQYSRKLGDKTYELADHLGNVVATISDKKIHPQELAVNGNQTTTATSFQADVTSRYDRFPFGMEILERSLSTSSANQLQNTSTTLYQGLLFSCSDYSVNSGVVKDCETDVNNVFGNTFVSSIAANSEEEDIQLTSKLKLSKVIPNIEGNAVYRIELMTINSNGRPLTASLGSKSGYITSPSVGSGASVAQIISSNDKLVSFELTAVQILAETNTLGNIIIDLISEANPGGFSSTGIEISEITISKLYKNTSIPLAKRNSAAYRYGFQGQELDNEWNGVAYGGGDLPLWEDAVQSKVIYNEPFATAASINAWTIDLNITSDCATVGTNGDLEVATDIINCGATSFPVNIESGKEYTLKFEVSNVSQGTFEIEYQAYNNSNSTWTVLQQYTATSSSNAINFEHKALINADQVRLKFYFSALPATSTAWVDNITLTKEINKWNLHPSPNNQFIGENGRMRLQTANIWEGGITDAIAVNKLGNLHTMYFDAEIVDFGGTSGVFMQVQESADGTSNWTSVGTKDFHNLAGNATYQIDFTPTQNYIRLYTSAGTAPSHATEVYFDNFRISEGTSEDFVGGGVGNKLAFKYRIHDASIGRFMSRDPLAKHFAWNSPYNFAENKVIQFIELEGLEIFLSKAQDIEYGGGFANAQEDMAIFTYNSAVSLYNGFVDVFNYAGEIDRINRENGGSAATLVTPASAAKVKGDVTQAANTAHQYVTTVTADEFAEDVYNVATDINTYEDIAGGIFGGYLTKGGKFFTAKVSASLNKSLAQSFYKRAGFSPQKAADHIGGIDMTKTVKTTTLKKGTVVQQWVGKNGVGDYFTTVENGVQKNLGINDYAKRKLKQYTLTEDVEVLKSTAGEYKGSAGGGTQYFSPELKSKVE